MPPPLYGGIELVIDLLSRGLQDAGHEVVLWTVGDSRSDVPRRSVLDHAEGQRIGLAVPELRHVIAAYDDLTAVDVIHDHTLFGPLYAGQFPDRVVVTTNHGPFGTELDDLYRVVTRRVPLLCISHDQRSVAPEIPVERVIHHGVDAAMFPVGAGTGGYCLFLGRMSPDKGAHRAIVACRKAGVPILLAAKMREAAEREYFEREVEPLLGADAEYLGEVAHSRKLELLGGAMALVNPIRWHEPFGLVMLEALACGTPVVAFREGAAPEIVDHDTTGFLCDDEAGIAEAIGQLGRISREACRAAIEGRFAASRMVAEHIEVYGDLLARRG